MVKSPAPCEDTSRLISVGCIGKREVCWMRWQSWVSLGEEQAFYQTSFVTNKLAPFQHPIQSAIVVDHKGFNGPFGQNGHEVVQSSDAVRPTRFSFAQIFQANDVFILRDARFH